MACGPADPHSLESLLQVPVSGPRMRPITATALSQVLCSLERELESEDCGPLSVAPVFPPRRTLSPLLLFLAGRRTPSRKHHWWQRRNIQQSILQSIFCWVRRWMPQSEGYCPGALHSSWALGNGFRQWCLPIPVWAFWCCHSGWLMRSHLANGWRQVDDKPPKSLRGEKKEPHLFLKPH